MNCLPIQSYFIFIEKKEFPNRGNVKKWPQSNSVLTRGAFYMITVEEFFDEGKEPKKKKKGKRAKVKG
jgi:hypothetical protein